MQRPATASSRPIGPAILCPHCGDRVPLDTGAGRPGDMTWTCRNGHTFGKRASQPPALAPRLRLLTSLSA